jgi:voltage-gated potassium channel
MRPLSTKILVYSVAIILVFIYGIAGTYVLGGEGQFNGLTPHGDNLINATYFTVVTLSTVGYGDITPKTSVAKIFVIILVLAGVSIFLSAVAVVGGEFMNSRIEGFYGRVSAFDRRLFDRHIVLIGTNSTNLYLADMLKERGERFIVVTSDKGKSEQLRSSGIHVYMADATSESDMQKFRLDRAKSIVIDSKDSSKAIYILLVAKSLAKDAKIVALAPTGEAERHIKSLHSATNVINPANIAAKAISNAIFGNEKMEK